MSRPGAARLAWTGWGLTVALAAAVLPFAVLNRPAGTSSLPEAGAFAGVIAAYATVGALVASRRPANPVGWLLGGVGLLFAAVEVADGYALHALVVRPGALPGGAYAAWANNWLGASVLMALVAPLLLTFPSGRPVGPRWRWVGRLALLGLLLGSLVVVRPGPFQNTGRPLPAVNSWGIPGAAPLADAASGIGFFCQVAATTLAVVSLVVRFRRARGVERQQLKWFAAAGGVVVALFVLPELLGEVVEGELPIVGGLSFVVAFGAVPAAVGIALLRHNLFDIDLIINRALVYGALTVGLAAVYAGSVLVAQAVTRPLTAGSDLAVAASTLAVAALFRPLRGRVQAFVDRRFYRRRYDAAKTLEEFRLRLRDEVDLDALDGELRGVLEETMRPAHVSLWLRPAAASRGGAR